MLFRDKQFRIENNWTGYVSLKLCACFMYIYEKRINKYSEAAIGSLNLKWD